MTWNPVRGCTRVSEGCRNCYAERIAARFSGPGNAFEGFAILKNGEPHWTGKVELVESKLEDPLHWKTPRRAFVNSMSDLFHEALSVEQIARVFSVMAEAGDHDFQVLTKRAERLPEILPLIKPIVAEAWERFDGGRFPWPLPNVQLGVSIENQPTADERIAHLLRTQAAVRFISYEPALGPVNLQEIKERLAGESFRTFSALDAVDSLNRGAPRPRLDWVIAGGESGPDARPPHPQWFRDVRDQCARAGVPFFFKQWGEWAPVGRVYDECRVAGAGEALIALDGEDITAHEERIDKSTWLMRRAGKADAGRHLDGREVMEFPTVRSVLS